MTTKSKKAPVTKPLTTMQLAAKAEAAVFADMDALAKRHGADVFRIAGQRYFKRQREEASVRAQIAAGEAELARMRAKVAR